MDFTRHTKQANCEACMLADVLKSCEACPFYVEYERATPADVSRIWNELWGEWPVIRTDRHVIENSEVLDFWQMEHETK